MQFSVKNVLDWLQNNGRVYTVRTYYTPHDDVIVVDGIGYCHREYVREVTQVDDLRLYVADSGFKTAESWWGMINRICKDKRKFLYYVRK